MTLAAVTFTQPGKYNDLCYPEITKEALKADHKKQILYLALSITAYVLVVIIAIVITLVSALSTIHIVTASLGLTLISASGFLFTPFHLKGIKLQSQIAKENEIIKEMKNQPSKEIHNKALSARIKCAQDYILKHEKSARISTEIEVKRKILEISFYNFLLNNPTNKMSFEEMFTDHYKDYNENERVKMLLNNPKFAMFTHKPTGRKFLWNDLSTQQIRKFSLKNPF
jgi:hypothetical protein